jgi:hypothetical protein
MRGWPAGLQVRYSARRLVFIRIVGSLLQCGLGHRHFLQMRQGKAYSTEDVALTRITLSQVEFGSQNYSRAGLCCLPSRNRRRPPRIYLCWPHTRAVRHSFSNLAIQLRRRENEGYRKVEPERCHRIYLALAFGNSDSHFAPDISIAWLYINLGSK